MQIAFLIYQGLTSLDIIGPYEVLARMPDTDVHPRTVIASVMPQMDSRC